MAELAVVRIDISSNDLGWLMHQGVNLLEHPGGFAVGLPYSIGLLLILGVHELGHYFTARHYGLNVSPPFFIPVPFALGTFGAFIQMKSPTRNRPALFDKWAVSEELIPATVHQALTTVRDLVKGRCDSHDPDPIQPVDLKVVESTIRHLPQVTADMVRFQMLAPGPLLFTDAEQVIDRSQVKLSIAGRWA